MSQSSEYFKSVNWTTGMLLTPQHFVRQDQVTEEQIAWLLKYCVPGAGLVGGGPRLDSVEQGLGKFDPKIEISNDGDTLRVGVLRARGITPGGEMVEVDESQVVRGDFSRSSLAGVSDVLVYLIRTGTKEPDPDSVGADTANPNQAALSRHRYEIRLGIPAELTGRALIVGKLRRASETLGFERDGQYIPPCASLLAHTSLYNEASTLQSETRLLVGEFLLVHEKAGMYAEKVGARGVDVRADWDIRAFVERAALALENCAYEISDLAIAPVQFFQQIERAGRLTALALNLSSSTRQFFRDLGQVDASYTDLLQTEDQVLRAQRDLDRRADLRGLVVRASETLGRLRQLIEALSGKYVDYRINRSVEAIRFLVDRDGEHFYESVTSPSHPQREGDLLTFVFNQLDLSGKHEYRVVLTGDPKSSYQWTPGQELSVTIRVNAAGGSRSPISQSAMAEVEGQRNFAVNFETPADVATIAGLTVTVQPGHGVRGAMLFRRRLGLASPGASGAGSMPMPAAAAPVSAPPPPPMSPTGPTTPPARPKITIKKPGQP